MKLKILALLLACALILGGCTSVVGIAETQTQTISTTSEKENKTEPATEAITKPVESKSVSTEQPKESKQAKQKKSPPLEAVNTKENYEKIFENFVNSHIYYDYGEAGGIIEPAVEAAPVEAAPVPAAPVTAPAAAEAAPMLEAPAMSSNDTAKSDYSSTNVQVAGVDEADLIKTDGKFIYYCMDDTLFALETDGKGSMKPVIGETYHDFKPIEMYLDDSYLIVIGSDSNANAQYGYRYYNYSNICTVAKIYERLDNGRIKLTRTVALDGSYLTSRKIAKSVYIITDSWRYDNIIPFYSDTAVSDSENNVPLDCMYIMPGYTNNSIMMVATIDLNDSEKQVDIQSFVGSADIVYMSKEALYISFSRWSYGDYGTHIYKFALESDSVAYEANGSVKGQLLNQFSMDEYNGYLRIAVTGVNIKSTSSNAVYILDGKLKEVSKIDSIAPGERIYSVRFMGGRGYVVTFRQTDPLFAFDLSDPKNPKLLGALKIPGYSTYLHPYDETHLIGFGQDTVETQNGAVLSTGIKISMFDVTDLTNPKEMFVTYIGDRGSTSPLLSNHKAILQDTAKNIFAFPATENRVTSKYKTEWTSGSFYKQGAFVYSIDMKKGFELRGVITHKSDDEALKAGMYYNNSETDVERIIYIGDYFYTVSRNKIQAHDIESLTLASQLVVGKALME